MPPNRFANWVESGSSGSEYQYLPQIGRFGSNIWPNGSAGFPPIRGKPRTDALF